ncbi:MAG TPA: glutamine synthetase III [Spirochaetota bacterium]|nr:glutamine synthetase III [Spirochaetota bacterium]HOS33519.1 glutamine synthetase III [Spirochaetota bacterium]HOS56569.1 glutamine synthetase III [Spirochaetota bacterium]HPK62860.1 glutamine synthetase III [Spirochaetota bacterium]HQF78543.1 glutamine synthetase III [Spirochaetota bacterium]
MPKSSEIFGELTFDKKRMSEKLNKGVYNKLMATIENDEPLDSSIAEDIAFAMKEWAIDNGATHFTHWFQPQRGGTAEKHDAFISYDDDGKIIEKFSSKQLIQSEPDASSFPSGGIRSTFEARGYTAWDPTSPAFLIKAKDTTTLVIPSIFMSWTGEVLDLKTPYLRSQKAIKESAMKIQKLLGNRMAKRIKVYVGPEQEYFLISKKLFETRADLQICGRTLFGATPAKGQQMEDHYFGAIKSKALHFMEELDSELYKRGIPSKTRHNEVAPNQFEVAPLYEEANLSIDHNLQLMDIIRQVADNNDLVVLLQEKPFSGVNGSGKHVNWSIGDNTGANYLEPSKSPLKNINFLITLAAFLAGVDKFGGLLRASVADAGNDHRLGANEAPPAIMSVYLGEYLTKILDEIEGTGAFTENKIAHISVGLQNLPKVVKDTSDRNRTSPVAFTGNKFEFRACGSSQNVSEPATILNLVTAYGYDLIYDKLVKMKGDVRANALNVVKEILKDTKRIRFEGNNYSKEWQDEAEKRGLPNNKNTPEALAEYLKDDTIKLFEKYKILSKRELLSKTDIKLETYVKIMEIEIKESINIAYTQITPAIAKHLANTAKTYSSLKESGIESRALFEEAKNIESLYSDVKSAIETLKKDLLELESIEDLHKKAIAFAGKGATSMHNLRVSVDKAEEFVADDLWPMAKYQKLITKL